MKYKVITYSVIIFLVLSQVFALAGADSVAGTPNSWTAKAPWPLGGTGYGPGYTTGGRGGGGAAVVNGTIYVFAGYGDYFYNPATDNWSAFAPMPTPRAEFAVAACDNKIYVIGGEELNITYPTALAVNTVYDPSTNTWASKSPMPIGTINVQAATVNGKIYAIGGSILTAGAPPYSWAQPTVNFTEIYDPVTDLWTRGAPIPYPVIGYAMTVVDNKIYVIGGQDEYNVPDINVNFTQIYDPASNLWSFGAPTPVSTMGAAAGATTSAEAPKRIYVIGGMGGFLVGLNQNYVYDPAANNWTPADPMPTARFLPTVSVVDDILYVIGGGQGDSSLATNEQYIPIGYVASTPSPSLSNSTSQNHLQPAGPDAPLEFIAVAVAAVVIVSAITTAYVLRKRMAKSEPIIDCV